MHWAVAQTHKTERKTFLVLFHTSYGVLFLQSKSFIEVLQLQFYFIRILNCAKHNKTCRRQIPLRSNITRRKANKTARLPYEKSRYGVLFYLGLLLEKELSENADFLYLFCIFLISFSVNSTYLFSSNIDDVVSLILFNNN